MARRVKQKRTIRPASSAIPAIETRDAIRLTLEEDCEEPFSFILRERTVFEGEEDCNEGAPAGDGFVVGLLRCETEEEEVGLVVVCVDGGRARLEEGEEEELTEG